MSDPKPFRHYRQKTVVTFWRTDARAILEKDKATYEEDDQLNESLHESRF